jgi:hypothetical protein
VFNEDERMWEFTYRRSYVGQLKNLAARTAARLLSRFHIAFAHNDLQAIASQGMALLVHLPPLLPELTRILGTASRSPPPPSPLLFGMMSRHVTRLLS